MKDYIITSSNAKDDVSSLCFDDEQSYRPHARAAPPRCSTVTEEESNSHNHSSQVQITTIALFGAHGKTGKHFLRLALQAGYHIRALVPNNDALVVEWNEALHTIVGDTLDTHKIKRVLRKADFVVCMLNDTLPNNHREYPPDYLVTFMKRLYTCMKQQPSIQVFLYQATSLAPDILQGNMPVMARVLKTVAQFKSPFLKDQQAALNHMAMEHGLRSVSRSKQTDENNNNTSSSAGFFFIITRPTVLLRDGPSTRKLSASRSQPGPIPISHIDLAEFSLNALRTEKLLNTCPYVVADSF